MSPVDFTPLHYCISSDGKFDGTTPADMEAAIREYAKVCDTKTLALFFHGGLVDKAAGLRGAATLLGPYAKPDDSGGTPGGNAYPYFFVWKSGLLEVLQRQLPQIAGEVIFSRLLDIIGTKARILLRGTPAAADPMMALRPPTVGVRVGSVPPNLEASQADIAEVERAVETDLKIQEEKQRIAQSATSIHAALAAARTTPTRLVQSSAATLLSPDIVNGIVAEQAQQNNVQEAGLQALWSPVSLGILALRAGKVLVRVVQRFATGRNHNFHNTVVEEILRQFYAANAGGAVWAEMKKETADAFRGDPSIHVGSKMIQELVQLYENGKRPRVTLLGHSTGAVYISNFLAAMDIALQGKQYRGEIKFDVIFMASAVRVDYFATTLGRVANLIGHFRAFGMGDSLESAEILVQLPGQPPTSPANEILAQVYTSSLLYFVAGVCEDADDDTPLVGMERFFTGAQPFLPGAFPAADAVVAFFRDRPNAVVLSDTPPDAGPGRRCRAHHHGGFPTEQETLGSVCYLLRTGVYNATQAPAVPRLAPALPRSLGELRAVGPRSNAIQIVPPRRVYRPAYITAEDRADYELVTNPLKSPTGPGGAPGFRNRAGSQIVTPHVTNVYMGTFSGDRGFFEEFSKGIVENGYLDPLKELNYGTGSGSYLGSVDVDALPPGTLFNDSDARLRLQTLLDAGKLNVDANSLFMMILPPGVTSRFDTDGSRSCSVFCGYHDAFTYKGVSVAYSILPSSVGCAGCGDGQMGDFMATYAHALGEACTDKVPGQGWIADDGQENADLEAWVMHGWGPPSDPDRYTVQGYYTNERGNTIGMWR
jgi:hypothetical protein